MATRPDKLPEFATDDVYVAVGEAWDGLANKSEPAASKLAEGYEPTERLPAQEFNWILNRMALALAFVINLGIANFRRLGVVEADGATELWGSQDADLKCGVWVSDTPSDGALMLFGEADSVSGNGLAAVLYSGPSVSAQWCTPPEEVDTTSPATVLSAVHDTTNDLVVVCGESGAIYTRPSASAVIGTWSQRLTAAGVTCRSVAHGTGTGASVLIVVGEHLATDDHRIYSSVDGVTWTQRSAVVDRPLYGVANKPGEMWVAVGDDNAGTGVIYYSADGSTWAAATVPAVDPLRGIVWDARAGLFFAWGDDGARLTSPNGTTWTDRTDHSEGWVDGDPLASACDGAGTIAVLCYVATRGWGVYVSTDGGLSFTDGHKLTASVTGETPRSIFWGGPWGWVIPCDVGTGAAGACMYVSGAH